MEQQIMNLAHISDGQYSAESSVWNGAHALSALDRWRRLIGETASVRRYEPETILLSENSSARRSYLVEEGVVALTHHLSSGKQVFLTLRSRGQIFGHSRHVLNHSFEFSACALTHCAVRSLDSQWLVERIRGGGDAGVLLMEQHAFDLYESGAALIDLVHLGVSERLTKFLFQFAVAAGTRAKDEMHVHVPLTDGYLASLLGVSPQQFCAIKRRLAEKGEVRHVRETQTWILYLGNDKYAANAA
jgi:CRP-like cAMP-binding protein